jgi:hypothetical protein
VQLVVVLPQLVEVLQEVLLVEASLEVALLELV